MKKTLLSVLLLLGVVHMPFTVYAQTKTVMLKTGTQVDLKSVKTIMAREVEIGDNVKFEVVSDVKQSGNLLIPAGAMADGVVTEAKKSSLAGTKGKLCIDIKSLTLSDGTKVPLTGTVRLSGKNRTPLAVITGVFIWPCIFIPGTKAVLTEGYNTTATVLSNTEVTVSL